MKLKMLFVILVVSILFVSPSKVNAQGMMGQFFNGSNPSVDVTGTAKDETEGKLVFDKLQSKQVTCQELSDDDFDVLGDYYMGQMAGNTESHAQMNARMTRMMGENGEKQMHIALGKRLSGCNTGAAYSSNNPNSGFAPMMGYGGGMMANFYNNYGINLKLTFFFFVVIVVGVVFLIQYYNKYSNKRKK